MQESAASGTLTDRSVLTLCPGQDAEVQSQWVPLRFVGAPDEPCILAPLTALPEWAKILERGSFARWRAGGAEYAGWARRLDEGDPGYRAAVDLFAAEFGAKRLGQWFSGHAACYKLMPQRSRFGTPSDDVEAFFDSVAADYDRIVAGNPLDAWLRQESVAYLKATFRRDQRVLEVGCGTGLETIPLAQAGVDVVAVDVSSEMLRRLDEKARTLGLSNRIQTRKLPASALGRVLEEFGADSFDGAFSDFGALNLDPGWSQISRSLATLVRPDGALVLGVWNRVCLVELALYSLALRPSRALARLHSPVPPGRSRFELPVNAFSPGPFLSAFAPAFRLESLQALPLLLPPYDLIKHVPSPERVLPLLESADRALRGRFPFNRLGDHFLARMRRVGE